MKPVSFNKWLKKPIFSFIALVIASQIRFNPQPALQIPFAFISDHGAVCLLMIVRRYVHPGKLNLGL
ncbi:hypothetical protein D3C73_1254760 [compost metagenome]